MIPTIKNVDNLFYFNACNYISNKMECFKNKNKFHIFISMPLFVTGFRKTDHIVTVDIARNTDLKY